MRGGHCNLVCDREEIVTSAKKRQFETLNRKNMTSKTK